MFSTEPIVEEKGLINLSCLHVYQLVECARFEMDLLVILYFDCALGQGRGGGAPLYRLYGMFSIRGTCFFKTF